MQRPLRSRRMPLWLKTYQNALAKININCFALALLFFLGWFWDILSWTHSDVIYNPTVSPLQPVLPGSWLPSGRIRFLVSPKSYALLWCPLSKHISRANDIDFISKIWGSRFGLVTSGDSIRGQSSWICRGHTEARFKYCFWVPNQANSNWNLVNFLPITVPLTFRHVKSQQATPFVKTWSANQILFIKKAGTHTVNTENNLK